MERETIRQLFLQHYGKMQRVARSLLYDEQEGEDVISDIFESLLRGHTMPMIGSEERYLLTSVRNGCLKRLRHEQMKRNAANLHNAQLLQEPDGEDELLTDITEFVAGQLSEQEQRLLRLRFLFGYSYKEIASQEGISRVAVWKHLSHAITEIKCHFNPRKL